MALTDGISAPVIVVVIAVNLDFILITKFDSLKPCSQRTN